MCRRHSRLLLLSTGAEAHVWFAVAHVQGTREHAELFSLAYTQHFQSLPAECLEADARFTAAVRETAPLA